MEALQNTIKQNKPLVLVIFRGKIKKQEKKKINQQPFVVYVMFYQRDAEMFLVCCPICNSHGASPTLWSTMYGHGKTNQSMVFVCPHSSLRDRGRKGKWKKNVSKLLMQDRQKLNLAATAFQQIFFSCLWLGRKKNDIQ